MKRIITLISFIVLSTAQMQSEAQTLKGQVSEMGGSSIPYAAVVLRSSTNQKVIEGCLSGEDGHFKLNLSEKFNTPGSKSAYGNKFILEVSSIGYKSAYRELDSSDLDAVFNFILEDDSEMLEAAVFSAELPKTRIEDDAIVTRVKSSVLEHSGNAYDVLAKVPGMMRQGDDIQVIGKGHPVYYINNRKVVDESELGRLQSEYIKEIEVISNPGSAYAADVSAVVRIRTIQRIDEGLSALVNFNDYQTLRNGNNLLSSGIALDWRVKKAEIMLRLDLNLDYLKNYSFELEQITRTEHIFKQEGPMSYNGLDFKGNFDLAFNYDFNENNSIGARLQKTGTFDSYSHALVDNRVSIDGKEYDRLLSERDDSYDHNGPTLFNVFYSGKSGKMNIDLNINSYSSSSTVESKINENSEYARSLSLYLSLNKSVSRMHDYRLVLAHPLGQGKLTAGSEGSRIRRDNDYSIDNEHIKNSTSIALEKNLSVFAEYSLFIERAGMLTAGLRFEHTAFDYDMKEERQSRSYPSLFPSISFATEIAGIQALISYSAKTRRPTFNDLRSGIEYSSRFTLNSGNPQLKNETIHSAGIALNKGIFSLSGSYERIENAIFDWTYPYDDSGTVLISMTNFPKPLRRFNLFLVASPSKGAFTSSMVSGIKAQRISLNLPDPSMPEGSRVVSYNRPMFIFNSNNYLRLGASWQLELSSEFYSKADFGNASLQENYWNLYFAVQKSFLRDKNLIFRLSIGDIFQTAMHDVLMDLGNYTLRQNDINGESRSQFEMHRAGISLKYNINSRKGTYRGKGSSKDNIDRL